MADRKTCFVIMPYGKKTDNNNQEIDFDYVYTEIIQEPVEQAGLNCIRCDELEEAGLIHDDMFAYIASAEVAIVDITALNANVFYELGVRHALKKAVTIIIRKQDSAIPFNIQGLRIIEYPDATGGYRAVREKIRHFIENGLKSTETDSPIQPILEKLAGQEAEPDKSHPISELKSYTHKIEGNQDRQIEIRTGDIRKWRGVDVWVNSENSNMQMARLYDRNLSALIRYCGAEKDANDQIIKDTIAIELSECMKGKESVPLGTVLATGSGALAATHGVKKIFHIASVYGIPGLGYRSDIEIIDVCIERCLRRMDHDASSEGGLKSIAFPMLGTGTGGGYVTKVAQILVRAVLSYFAQNPQSQIEKVIFMAWNGNDLDACLAALSNSNPTIGGKSS